MSEPLSVQAQIDELKNLGNHYTARLQKRLGGGLLKQGQYVAGEIRKKIRDRHAGGRSVMANSYNVVLVNSNGEIVGVEVMSTLPYAGIQNYGGVIKPKRGKYLTIPLTGAAKRRGAREWTDLVFITSKKGNKLLATVKKARGNRKDKITPQYLLAKKSTIKGSGYLEAAADVAAPVVAAALANYVDLAIIDATKGGE